MPCELLIAVEVKRDILECDSKVQREIYKFLRELQKFPLPDGSKRIKDLRFFHQLPNDCFIEWEILGGKEALLKLLQEETTGVTVRVLGVGASRPSSASWKLRRIVTPLFSG